MGLRLLSGWVKKMAGARRKQRRYPRVHIQATVELVIPEDYRVTMANANNIGYGGMGVCTKEPVEIGKEVWVKIHRIKGCAMEETVGVNGGLAWSRPVRFWAVSGENASELIRGEIRWCSPRGPWYAAGIEFKNLNSRSHGRILDFLRQMEGSGVSA